MLIPNSSTALPGLRQLADSAALLFWMTDADGLCIYLNQTAHALLGMEVSFSIFTWLEFVHPEDRSRLESVFTTARQECREYQIEYRILRSDGSIRWMMGSGAPRFASDGVCCGFIGVVIDVSERRDNLARLVKSEATLRLVTDHSSDLITHHAPDSGNYLYISPSVRHILGFDPSELIGISVYDLVHPDDEHIVRSEIAKQSAGEAGSGLIEFRVRNKAGQYIWMGTNVQVLLDRISGAKVGAVAVSRDITADRRAQDELRHSEERFRSLTDLSSDWYWETDQQGRVTFMSEGLHRLFGTSPEGVLGKTRAERAADPNQPGLLEYNARLARREPFRDLRYSVYIPSRDAVRHASISGEPVYEQGEFKGYRGTGCNITEEIELARRLAQLAEENEALIENSLDIIAMLDHEGRFLRLNEAVKEALGYEPQEMIGRRYTDFLHPDEQARVAAIDANLRTANNTVLDLESHWVRKDGTMCYLSLSVRWSEQQKQMYATGRNITERFRTQEELRRSKDRLFSILESIGDAFFALDRNWRVTYVNERTARFVGKEREELLGRLLWDAVPEVLDSPVFEHYKKAMNDNKKSFIKSYWEPKDAWVEVRTYPSEEGISVYFHDVTARHKAEEAIRSSEQRLREVIEMTPAGYMLIDSAGGIVDVNPALCGMAGYMHEELVGRDASALLSCHTWLESLFAGEASSSIHGREAIIRHKDGRNMYVLVNANLQRDARGNACFVTAFVTDITERKQVEHRLEQLATHDTLTGLPNRALLNERLQLMLDTVQEGQSVGVFFLDLDRFKEVNDSMGHAPGDRLLCEVAQRLKGRLRPADVVARLGGDEFVVAAVCPRAVLSATRIVENLLAAFIEPVDVGGQEVFVRASIGISLFPEDGTSRELLFQSADTAMYQAKAAGRNCYCFFKTEMSIQAKARMTMESSLHRALERREFELRYQPRLDLTTMTVVGMEALIRWNHPQLGQVSPMEFIPIAEERGLIDAIGKWVLEEACMQTRRLIDQVGRPLRVSVNLSARQLKNDDLVDHVERSLRNAGLPSKLLELELTETALVDDMEVSASVFRELKQLGISLAVDDFGTGYSGLAYLGRFPLDVLKLDRSFVNQQGSGNDNLRVVKAFVEMAHALGLSVVAEGVETSETLQFLRDIRCDEAQGYLFAQPLAVAGLEEFLSKEEAVSKQI